jgi:hypothetical protein
MPSRAWPGVYIYDYLPDERIRQRANERYTTANEYFRRVPVTPESRTIGREGEVITMAILLSMQDVRTGKLLAFFGLFAMAGSNVHSNRVDRTTAQDAIQASVVRRFQAKRGLPTDYRSPSPSSSTGPSFWPNR